MIRRRPIFAAAPIAVLLIVALGGDARAADLFNQGDDVLGWTVTGSEHHAEYVRYFFTHSDGRRTGVEIIADDGPAAEWRTGRHRLMPAPTEQPPQPLLLEVLRRLRQYEGSSGAALAEARAPDVRTPSTSHGRKQAWRLRGSTRVWSSPALLHGLLVLGFLWACLRLSPSTSRGIDRFGELVEAHPIPWLTAILGLMFVARIPFLGEPFSVDAETQRLFFASLDVSDILAHRYADARHPQLSYLIAHPFVTLSHAEAVARLPAALASLAAAAGAYAVARLRLSAISALAAAALVGASLPLLEHSCTVSDVPLFAALVAWSTYALVRALEAPGIRVAVAVGLLEVAMFYTYYFAPVVAICHLAVALVHGRTRRHLPVWIAGGVALLAATPALGDLMDLVAADRQARAAAEAFPAHLWGQESAVSLLPQIVGLLGANEIATPLLVLAALGVVRLARRPWRDALSLALPLIAVTTVATLAATATSVRLKPYYALYLLPLVAALVAAGCFGRRAEDRTGWRRALAEGLGVAALSLVLLSQLLHQSKLAPHVMRQPEQDRFARLGYYLRTTDGPSTIIADPDNLHTLLVYYALDAPKTAYRTCAYDDTGVLRCSGAKRQLLFLSSLGSLEGRWRQRAVEKLRQAQTVPTRVIYTHRFPNVDLREELTERCRLEASFGTRAELEVYDCPAR